MHPTDTHKAYGVSKPVGHILVSFPTVDDAQAALSDLRVAHFDEDAVHYYSPGEMLVRADEEIRSASFVAALGQELNLAVARRELAETGHAFLTVRAHGDAQTRQVTDIALSHHADRAQKYGRLIIEELIEPGTGERQVAESPDRGLDPQTSSGHEGDNSLQGLS
jgi:hypothetical protein